jgi:hypothetical protein
MDINESDGMVNDPMPNTPPGVDKAKPAKEIQFKPSLFKMPMHDATHDRRLMDFNEFLERINYKTHDGILQKGHGQNLTGKP